MRKLTAESALAGALVIVAGGLLLVGLIVVFKSLSGVALATGLLGTFLSWVVTVLIGLLGVFVAVGLSLAATSIVFDRVEARLKDRSKSYTSFVGLFVGVCTFVLSQVLNDAKIVNGMVAVIVATCAAVAGECLKRWPRVGFGLYLAILIATAVVTARATSVEEARRWVTERTDQDWILMGFTALIVIGVPLVVWLVERSRRKAVQL